MGKTAWTSVTTEWTARDSVTSVERAGGEVTILEERDVPFVAVPAVEHRPPTVAERAFAWSQRWRLPLTLLFGVLIAGAAFFAYETKQDDPLTATDAAGSDEPVADALSAAVGGLAADELIAPDDRSDGGTTRTGGTVGEPSSTTVDRSASNTRQPVGSTAAARSATGRPTTSSPGPSTTVGGSPSTTAGTSTTESPATTPTTAPRSATSAPSTTAAPSTTTTAPARTQPPPPAPATIGNRVTIDTSDGAGYAAMPVRLLADDDRDGTGGATVDNTVTDGGGYYAFTAAAGCYVVAFSVPDGYSPVGGDPTTAICVDPGQAVDGVDLVIALPVPPPPSCDVQIADNRYAGVEVRDSNRNWAPSYAFFDQSGDFVLSTSSLGPPDDTTNPSADTIEWTSSHYDYEESVVYSVAAEDENGRRSSRVTCSRRNV